MGSLFSGGQKVENQTQSYTANPMTTQYGSQALANFANANPYANMSAQPVAGFNPDQYAAFTNVRNMQGATNPYFQTASNYLTQSGQPINMGDVSNLYNQMADPVMRSMKDVFGQQMSQTTGNLTQAAGGVGADRIGVGQAELAKQQGLAAGQTGTSLLRDAVNTYMQQKQMQGTAGMGLAQTGLGAQTANLRDIGALEAAGKQQQGQTQNELLAPWQFNNARQMWGPEQAMALAQMTGQLAPAFGGTQTGTKTSQQNMSPMAGILGLAGSIGGNLLMPGVGGALGSALGSGIGSMFGGNAAAQFGANAGLPGGGYQGPGGQVYQGPGYYDGGGRIPYAYGGSSPFMIPWDSEAPASKDTGSAMEGIGKIASKAIPMLMSARGGAVNPFDLGAGFAAGGYPDEEDPITRQGLIRGNLSDEPLYGPPEEAIHVENTGAAPGLSPSFPVQTESFRRENDGTSQEVYPQEFNSPALNSGRGLPPTASRYTDTDDASGGGFPPAIQPQSPPSMGGASGLPALPKQAPLGDSSMAGNFGSWLSRTGAGMLAAAGKGMAPAGAFGVGAQEANEFLENKRKTDMQEKRLLDEANRMLFDAGMKQMPYKSMTLAEQAQEARLARPYSEMTAAARAEDARARERMGLEERRETRQEAAEKERLEIARRNVESGRWQYLGPGKNGKGSVFMDAKEGKPVHFDVDIWSRAAPRALSPSVQKDLETKANNYHQLSDFRERFTDAYTQKGPKWTGDLKNYVARQTALGNVDAANWWQDYQSYVNQVRHGLFGAALTGYEISQWNQQDINPGMAPEVIRHNLDRQWRIVQGAMRRKAESLITQGQSKDAIEAQFGVKIDDLPKPIADASKQPGGAKPPPIGQLEEGMATEFQEGPYAGQAWTLDGGKPKRLK